MEIITTITIIALVAHTFYNEYRISKLENDNEKLKSQMVIYNRFNGYRIDFINEFYEKLKSVMKIDENLNVHYINDATAFSPIFRKESETQNDE